MTFSKLKTLFLWMFINSFISEYWQLFVVFSSYLKMESINRLVLLALVGIFFITNLANAQGQQGNFMSY